MALPVRDDQQWIDRTLLFSLAAAFSWWAAFPPLELRLAAWLPAVFWTLILQELIGRIPSSGKVYWFKIWIGGYLGWLGLLQWMCYPVVWTAIAWMVISATLAGLFVLQMFAALLLAQWRIPVPIAIALSWTGVEWLRRTWFLGGFPFAALEHSQYAFTHLIQVASIAGEYGLGTIMVLVGALLGQAVARQRRTDMPGTLGRRVRTVVIAFAVLLVAMSYGTLRIDAIERSETDETQTGVRRIALLQGSTELAGIVGPADVESAFIECLTLALELEGNVDLIVWPEGACPLDWTNVHKGYVLEELHGLAKYERDDLIEQARVNLVRPLIELAEKCDSAILVNVRIRDFIDQREFPVPTNSALLVDPLKGICERYDKAKLAPFLECNPTQYLCGCDLLFPSPFRFGARDQAVAFPIPCKSQLTNGSDPVTRNIERRHFVGAVNICYESMFPKVIRQQITKLRSKGMTVDVLMNLSNDGDCSRRSAIDMHFATHVFRAVENGIPYLVASNCGRAAWIDNSGRILRTGTIGKAECLVVNICHDTRPTVYARVGNIWPQACAGITVLAFALSIATWFVSRL